jgi:hypothetical protein
VFALSHFFLGLLSLYRFAETNSIAKPVKLIFLLQL